MTGSVVISYFVFKLNCRLKKRNGYNFAYFFIIAMCVLVLLLPNGTIWQRLGEGYINEEEVVSVKLDFSLSTKSYETILISVQDEAGITVDVTEIPVQQFIGGGISKTKEQITNLRYDVLYIDATTVRIRSEGIKGNIRIWGK